jgi:predicted Zn-dependent protease
MRIRLLPALLACSLTLGLASSRAALNLPDLGDASEAVISRNAEQTLGTQTMNNLRGSGTLLDDPEVNAYLNQLGHKLLQADPSQSGQSFSFFAVGSRELNAFALPGGYVGVNSGLILATQNESELASVLAHEISHVTQHHIARQIAAQTSNQMATMAALLGALVAAGTGNGQVAMAAITGATAAQLQSQINYTREHEQEADRVGFQLLSDAGFDPRAMASFFERLQKSTRLVEGNVPSYMRTHPLTQTRIAEAQDLAFSKPYRQIKDSQEYHLVRALLRSYDGTPQEAVSRMSKELAEGRYPDRAAARYGLAAARLRAQDFAQARKDLDALEKDGFQHPMYEALLCQVLMQSGQLPTARSRYEEALKRYPNHLQLVYDYPRLLMQMGDKARAARFAEARLLDYPHDATLHQTAAEAWAGAGQMFKSHYHQGEYYAALGRLKEADEQFTIASRSPDGDTHDLLILDPRMKAIKEQLREQRRNNREGP